MDADKFRESLDFVTAHYREDAFLPDRNLFRTRRRFPEWLRRHGVAAAVAAGILTAAACAVVFTLREHRTAVPEPVQIERDIQPGEVNTVDSIVKIEFTDAPLPEVVKEIEKNYHVTVENVPETDLRLTLSYEGTASDLVDTINDLLGTALKISK